MGPIPANSALKFSVEVVKNLSALEWNKSEEKPKEKKEEKAEKKTDEAVKFQVKVTKEGDGPAVKAGD